MSAGITDHTVLETPIAVLDFETTGLTAGTDRVVEVSVMRLEPGSNPKIVLDTLVNPERPVAATEIHGITDADVAQAPKFAEIAGEFARAICDCAVAAYNVYFDMRFFEYEMQRAGITGCPPHFCLMYMRPMLELGARCRLGEACQAHGIEYDETHVAAQDVEASAQLMEFYFKVMRERNIRTFGDLAALRKYKFVHSFWLDPIRFSTIPSGQVSSSLKSRSHVSSGSPTFPELARQSNVTGQRNAGLGVYWNALKAAVADLQITDQEVEHLRQTSQDLRLQPEQVRVLHARAFASVISQFIDDQWLDDRERRKLKRLHQCLSLLGWAPGE